MQNDDITQGDHLIQYNLLQSSAYPLDPYLSTLLEQAAEGYAVFEPDTLKMIYCNPAFLYSLQLSLEALRTFSLVEQFPGFDLHFEKRQSVTMQSYGSNGKVIDLEASAFPARFGEAISWMVSVRDVTTRREEQYSLVKQRDQARLLNQIIKASYSGQDSQSILKLLCAELAKGLNRHQTAIALLDQRASNLRFVADFCPSGCDPLIGKMLDVVANPTLQNLLTTGVSLTSEDLVVDARFNLAPGLSTQWGFRAAMLVPLMINKRGVGLLCVFSNEPGLFLPDEAALVEGAALAASKTLEVGHLFEKLRVEIKQRDGLLEQISAAEEEIRRINRELSDARSQAASKTRMVDEFLAAISEETHTQISSLPELLELLRSTDTNLYQKQGEDSHAVLPLPQTEKSPLPENMGVILLVEDNNESRRLGTVQLQKLGFQVDAVETGRKALEAVRSSPKRYALILMDVEMPDMDGIAATRAIRQGEKTPGWHVPIVAITASSNPGDREKSLAAGMDDVLRKPVNIEMLGKITDRFIRHQPSSNLRQTKSFPVTILPATLDHKVLENIRELQTPGQPDFLTELIDMFFVDSRRFMDLIRFLMESGKLAEMHRPVHSLKGTSANLGAALLPVLCNELEGLLEKGDLKAVQTYLPTLEEEYQRVRAALNKERVQGK